MRINIKNFVFIGEIIKPHGLLGYLKFYFYNENSRILKKNITVHLVNELKKFEFKVERLNVKSTVPLIKLFNVNDRNHASDFRGFKIGITKSTFKSNDNEIYLFSLIDCEIFFDTKFIGKVINVNSYSGNDLLEVKTESDKICLIPINKKLIKFYDTDNRKLFLKEIKGILSL